MTDSKGTEGEAMAEMEESGDEVDSEEKFDWDQYFSESNSVPAAKECFWQGEKPPKNSFKIGQKLEAVDPKNNSITSVATIVAMYGPKVKIRLDGAGKSNDFWTLVDSSKIHPFGYTEENGGHLQPPWSYEKDPVRYQNTIINSARESGLLAPESCFLEEPPRPNSNMFKIGTKLEAIDARSPTWVCPATVVGRDREKIKIEYDGWDQQDLVRYDSRDLYPCGWWKQAGIDIVKPPVKKKLHTGKRGRPPLKRPIRPHSVGPVNDSPPSSGTESRNIFDSVLAKASVSPSPQPRPGTPDSISKTVASVSTGSELKPAVTPDKVSSGTSSPAVSLKDSTPTSVVKHHARKTIAARADPVSQEKKVIDVPSTSAKPTDNGITNHKDSPTNNGLLVNIPEPDAVITLASKSSDVRKYTLRFNENCNAGPHLDLEKLTVHCSAVKEELPMQLLVREAFQILVYSARPESTLQVFNAIPAADMKSTKGLTVSCYDKDQRGLIRTIPMYSSAAAAKRALKDVLTTLMACLNLVTTGETGCKSCDGPVAKKMKPSDTGITIDLTRKQKPNDVDVAVEPQEPAPWWAGQDPSGWSVDDVVRFIASVMNPEAADLFKRQEIDGHALVLLTPEILIKFMDVRVGPAVKISNAIERLKGTSRPNYVVTPTDVPAT